MRRLSMPCIWNVSYPVLFCTLMRHFCTVSKEAKRNKYKTFFKKVLIKENEKEGERVLIWYFQAWSCLYVPSIPSREDFTSCGPQSFLITGVRSGPSGFLWTSPSVYQCSLGTWYFLLIQQSGRFMNFTRVNRSWEMTLNLTMSTPFTLSFNLNTKILCS